MTARRAVGRGVGLLGVLGVLGAVGVAAAQEPGDPPLDAEVVRRALTGTGEPSDWATLEEGAIAAADGPFVLRDLRVDDASTLELRLSGYGLPTMEQVMKPGTPARVVVSLPGAQSALPHGHELTESGAFTTVRVGRGPEGVRVEAVLPVGMVAVIDESAEGVRIRPVEAASPLGPAFGTARGDVPDGGSGAAADGLVATTLHHLGVRLDALRGGRWEALLPLGGLVALVLILASGLRLRDRERAGGRGSATDARRLAERLAPSSEA